MTRRWPVRTRPTNPLDRMPAGSAQGNRIWRDAGGELPPPERGRVGAGDASGAGRAADVFKSPIFAAATSSRFSVAPETPTLVRSVALTPTPTLPLSGGGSAPPEVLHMRFRSAAGVV